MLHLTAHFGERRLADLELLGEILDGVRDASFREQSQHRPLTCELL